ncbi:hypothetical protein BD413DRAFT_68418 [Trametes elegans]|nr:hypothetical protein BD413DRAFT_68418 [Trametes elegans]
MTGGNAIHPDPEINNRRARVSSPAARTGAIPRSSLGTFSAAPNPAPGSGTTGELLSDIETTPSTSGKGTETEGHADLMDSSADCSQADFGMRLCESSESELLLKRSAEDIAQASAHGPSQDPAPVRLARTNSGDTEEGCSDEASDALSTASAHRPCRAQPLQRWPAYANLDDVPSGSHAPRNASR